MSWRARRDSVRSAVVRDKQRQERQIGEGKIECALGYSTTQTFPGGLPKPAYCHNGGRAWVFE